MNIKKAYTADVRYGVVTAKYSNVILVGDPPVVNADTLDGLNALVQGKPLQEGRPLHEVIPSIEYFRQYIEDNNLTIDPEQSLEDLRDSAEQFFATPEWAEGEKFELVDGKVPFIERRHNNVLYELIQVHTTQVDWTPDVTPALWKVSWPIGLIPLWEDVKPTGSHDTIRIGRKIIFDSRIYESIIDYNAYAPSEYPQGWLLISEPEEPSENPCEGVQTWDPNDHWTTYVVGDRRVDEGKLYECHNVGFSYYKPSGPNGHHGWTFIQNCTS